MTSMQPQPEPSAHTPSVTDEQLAAKLAAPQDFVDLEGLAKLGSSTIEWASEAVAGETPAQQELRETQERVRRFRAQTQFRDEIRRRHDEAYDAGADAASDKASRKAANARSLALYLVVLAVVLMPFTAILIGLEPEAFGAYIAPITAIAGTVVGYWFGTADRQSGASQRPSSR
jgi:hypothetical protein